MIRHIVAWRLKDAALGNGKAENARLMKDKLEALRGRIPGLLRLEVGRDFSATDNSADVVFVADFDSREALAAYQQAWAELKTREPPRKVEVESKASKAKPPKALMIRAKRGKPEQQSLSIVPAADANPPPSVEALLEQAHAAEAAGRPQDALPLYREAARRIREASP